MGATNYETIAIPAMEDQWETTLFVHDDTLVGLSCMQNVYNRL